MSAQEMDFEKLDPVTRQAFLDMQKRAEAAEKLAEEEKRMREDMQKRAEEEKKMREDMQKRAEEEKKMREDMQKRAEAAEKLAEEEKRMRENVERHNDALKQQVQQLTNEKVEYTRKAMEETPLVKQMLALPLPQHGQLPTPKKVKTSTQGSKKRHFVHLVRKWEGFEALRDKILDRVKDTRMRLKEDFSNPHRWLTDKEVAVHGFVTPVLSLTMEMLEVGLAEEKIQEMFDRVKFGSSFAGSDGGLTDVFCGLVNKENKDIVHHKLIGELKASGIIFRDDNFEHPVDMLFEGDVNKERLRNLVDILRQTVSYQISKPSDSVEISSRAGNNHGVKYGFFTNYDEWVFIRLVSQLKPGAPPPPKGKRGEMELVLEVSPFYTRENARLALACILLESLQDNAVEDYLKIVNNSGVFVVEQSANGPRVYLSGGLQGESSKLNRTENEPTEPGPGDGGAHSSRAAPSNFFDEGTQVAGYEFVNTELIFGAEVAPLLGFPDATILSCTDKSTTYRGTVNGIDLVWRQIDVDGLPATSPQDFGDGQLRDMIAAEVRCYMRLQSVWGSLVPRFVGFARDFNMLWVLITTYEGVSIDSMDSVPRRLIDKARASLLELHDRGVVHGDVHPRNALYRSTDDSVLWIDFELSKMREDFAPEVFESIARAELEDFTDRWEDLNITEDCADLPELDETSENKQVAAPQINAGRESEEIAEPLPSPPASSSIDNPVQETDNATISIVEGAVKDLNPVPDKSTPKDYGCAECSSVSIRVRDPSPSKHSAGSSRRTTKRTKVHVATLPLSLLCVCFTFLCCCTRQVA